MAWRRKSERPLGVRSAGAAVVLVGLVVVVLDMSFSSLVICRREPVPLVRLWRWQERGCHNLV
jgi:hypothetical protein